MTRLAEDNDVWRLIGIGILCILSTFPSLANATLFEREILVDLMDPLCGSSPPRDCFRDDSPGMSWTPKFQRFDLARPETGDTLLLRFQFGNLDGDQRLVIQDLGLGIDPNLMIGLADQFGGGLSVDYDTTQVIRFIDPLGELLSNDIAFGGSGGGSGIGSGAVSRNLTDSAFSFRALEWEISFSRMDYLAGSGVDNAEFFISAEGLRVCSAFPGRGATLGCFPG